MTEFDFAEMIQGAVSNAMTSFTIWLTIVSGYLFVAYSAGKALNTAQTVIINTLYVVTSAIFAAITFIFLSRAVKTIYIKAELYPSAVLPLANGPVLHNVALSLAFLMFCGILASLYFMVSARHAKN